ncbi:hypothetical protein TanjilG_13151 [Lupinus angustifolius]|nr:hypothetical protein TanjilG_13151 [Lupinus angustifolius]
MHEISPSHALQRQLQQLFHLHDSGLDQAFIDALPVFEYREILGPKEPFDCAVCLCEFSDKDKLRLLPMCSHAFHMCCIDTWLLSNSTCPICRVTLFTQGFSIHNPMFDFDDLREEDEGCPCNVENGFDKEKKVVIEESVVVEKGVLPIRLGKLRKVSLEEDCNSGGVGETSSSNLDARRCYSMGSYQYVVGNSELRVALNRDPECRDLKFISKGTEHQVEIEMRSVEGDMEEAKRIRSVSKGESFSESQIWLWPKKANFSSSSEAPQMSMPSFLNTDLPRMMKTEGV